MTNDRWLAMIDERLKELENQIAPLEAERVALTKAREAYVAEVTRQGMSGASSMGVRGVARTSSRRTGHRGGVSAGRSRTLGAEIERLLRDVGEPLHVSQILEKLADRGVVVRGQRPTTNIAATMHRSSRFRNLGRNTWELADPPTHTHESAATGTDTAGGE